MKEYICKKDLYSPIYIYRFKDGAVVKLIGKGLSVEEILKMEEIHGKRISIYD